MVSLGKKYNICSIQVTLHRLLRLWRYSQVLQINALQLVYIYTLYEGEGWMDGFFHSLLIGVQYTDCHYA